MNSSDLRKTLESESGHLCWQELEPHFARGVLRVVNKQQSLVDMALNIAQNKTEEITSALASDDIAAPSNSQAQQWQQQNSNFLCVVVAPYVLIQECESATNNECDGYYRL